MAKKDITGKLLRAEDEAMAMINGALAILQKFPQLNEAEPYLNQMDFRMNPFQLLLQLFKNTAGYDYVINLISKYIAYVVPELEVAVRGLILTTLRNMLSCSVNPLMTADFLREGITFTVDEIDLLDTLRYSPFDQKVGKYFYFGTEELQSVDDLKFCNDMDAFIWYVINRSNQRCVWKSPQYRNPEKYGPLDPETYQERTKKGDGIITLDFYEKAINAIDADGNPYKMQRPYNNCLHVFIGDARGMLALESDLSTAETNLSKKEREIEKVNEELENIGYDLDEIYDEQQKLEEQLANEEITQDEYGLANKKLESKKKKKEKKEKELNNILSKSKTKKQEFQAEIALYKRKIKSDLKEIFGSFQAGRNYYTMHPLIEFNIDYMMSLRFFDKKVLTARLIDVLLGLPKFEASFSWKRELVKSEVRKMVSMIAESDDITVSDCFFTFSNDDYDAMSRQAELKKAGLISVNGNEIGGEEIDVESLLSNLNGITPGASNETIQSVIKGTLTEMSGYVTNTNYTRVRKVDIQFGLIEYFLDSLCYALVSAVLSPKTYLLILINLKVLGRGTDFSLEQFLQAFKNLIVQLIRTIRDMLLNYLVNELMKIVEQLAKEVMNKLVIEQAEYYAILLKRCIDCFKRRRNDLDFTLDDIEHADIYNDDSEPANAEC